jgi:hypothetical protein
MRMVGFELVGKVCGYCLIPSALKGNGVLFIDAAE